ncbi:MAG: radical SAM protein [Lachnospiraceae bacterium]|nr:radical SAM protein [Lachnospiraceae bacterium]
MFELEKLKGKPIVLFGAGNEGVCAADFLKRNKLIPVCFCDNYKQGEKAGLPIKTLDETIRSFPDAQFIVTAIGYMNEIVRELKEFGVNETKIVMDFKVHLIKQTYLSYYEINIVDHCNISCMGCSHFSPIAEERVSSLETVQNDLHRMSELTAGNVDEIHILGGEPLLHPDLEDILITAREVFPHTVISIISNGVRLLQQEERFWNVCRNNQITVEVTKYPINLDYGDIMKTIENKDIAFKFHSYTGKATKTLYKMPLDIEGSQDIELSFSSCTLANRWIALMDGKMYTCQIAPNIHHFNKKFGTNMNLDNEDYIDIYKVESIDEILSFLSTPKPFCKYCKTTEVINALPWQPSRKEMNEWT